MVPVLQRLIREEHRPSAARQHADGRTSCPGYFDRHRGGKLASDEPVTAEHAHAGDKQVRGLHALAVSGERFFTMFLQARAEILLALVFLHAAAHVAGVMVVAASLELKVWKLYE